MTYKIKLLNSIAIFSFLFISCEDPSTKKEPFPIADINFDYLQGSNKLFVSAQVNTTYMNSSLDSVEVLWKGVDQQNKNDTLKLYDDGTMGDILSSDNIFSRRIPNSNSIISNVIPSQAKDSIFLSILSFYKNRSIESDVSPFILGNIHPKIGNFNLRDSVTRPAKNNDPNIVNSVKFTVAVPVSDANGLEDIKRAFFRSYHVELDSMMNGGNPIFLLDDGGGVNGSGDLQKADGTFSRTIAFPSYAEPGTYHWIFEAQDQSNAYSDTVKKIIVVK